MVQTLQIGQAAQCAWRQITYTRERRADGPQNNYALKKWTTSWGRSVGWSILSLNFTLKPRGVVEINKHCPSKDSASPDPVTDDCIRFD